MHSCAAALCACSLSGVARCRQRAARGPLVHVPSRTPAFTKQDWPEAAVGMHTQTVALRVLVEGTAAVLLHPQLPGEPHGAVLARR
jgi:hypothetical protein